MSFTVYRALRPETGRGPEAILRDRSILVWAQAVSEAAKVQ